MLLYYAAMADTPTERSLFEDIYHQYRRQMLAVALRVLHDHAEAEDAVQNALLGIARNIDCIPADDPRATRAYVLTAAKNAALALLPKKQRRDTILDIEELNIAAADNAFESVVQSQDYQRLLTAIGQLDPIYRDVLLLVYVYEHDIETAAALLQRKPETVRKQLYRGKQLLAKLYFEEDTQ